MLSAAPSRKMKRLLTSSTLHKTAHKIGNQRRLPPSPIAWVQTKHDKSVMDLLELFYSPATLAKKLQVDISCFPLEYEEEKQNILLKDTASALHRPNVNLMKSWFYHMTGS